MNNKTTEHPVKEGQPNKADIHHGSTTQGGSDFGQGSNDLGNHALRQGSESNEGSNYDSEKGFNSEALRKEDLEDTGGKNNPSDDSNKDKGTKNDNSKEDDNEDTDSEDQDQKGDEGEDEHGDGNAHRQDDTSTEGNKSGQGTSKNYPPQKPTPKK